MKENINIGELRKVIQETKDSFDTDSPTIPFIEGDGIGVDIILDIVGGDYLDRNIRLLKPDGRLLQVSLMAGVKGELNLARLMSRRLTLTGSTLRPRPVAVKGEIASSLKKEVWPLLEKDKVFPVIDSVFPLKEAYKAHELMESSTHIGKIILSIG